MEPETIASLTQGAFTAGRARASMPEQGKAAASRLIEDYTRYRAGDRLAGTGQQVSLTKTNRLLLFAGIGSFLGILLLLVFTRRRRTRHARLFPLTENRARFSAPHSGGNNAMTTFRNDG